MKAIFPLLAAVVLALVVGSPALAGDTKCSSCCFPGGNAFQCGYTGLNAMGFCGPCYPMQGCYGQPWSGPVQPPSFMCQWNNRPYIRSPRDFFMWGD